DGISLQILQGHLKPGDNLPSINEMSDLLSVSRDTVFKAYKELKKLHLIESNPMKGYYITGNVQRILLLLDTYSSFKQDLYKQFVAHLSGDYKVDLIFHQYNQQLFETIVRESAGKYSMYVVMNFSNEVLSPALQKIPAHQLLLLDFGNFDKSAYNYICQDFDSKFFECLVSVREKLAKYRHICFVFPTELLHPASSIDALYRFGELTGTSCSVLRDMKDWKGVEPSTLYLGIVREDIVAIVKSADEKGLELGKDVGLLIYNEEPLLEVIKNGISSISIDFGQMGMKAARFVTNREPIQEYLPTKIFLRASL
ncbi:MAG: GntR family transcriptional regulator, partial [Ignavibacteria bacterium]|nr:GntR family transcriptional regulator [Ignavibacteria bacterium]